MNFIRQFVKRIVREVMTEIIAEKDDTAALRKELSDLREAHQKHIHNVGEKFSTSHTTGKPIRGIGWE